MSAEPAVDIEQLVHRYGSREALRGVSFRVEPGEIFALLGPNGGGKTTLFRILSTAMRPTAGRATIFGHDVAARPAAVRPKIGVVFQAPSLDKKLTVAENLTHHGHLYGWSGSELAARTREMLGRVGLADRDAERVERLSGGQQRRVEVAKGMLHQPRLLLMDEPSTGLDPGARRDLWDYLRYARQRDGITILLTTHLMDEAEQCDRVAILHEGALVALGTPHELASHVGGDVVTIAAANPEQLAAELRERLHVACSVLDDTVHIRHDRGHELIGRLYQEFAGTIRSVTVRQPSLDDVFLDRTGHRFWQADATSFFTTS